MEEEDAMEDSVCAPTPTDSQRAAECRLCALETATEEPPGGWIYRDKHWSIFVLAGTEVPGWLIIQSRPHVEALWDVPQEGTASLGPLLAATSRGIQRELGAEHVYLMAFGETMAHWHMLLAATPDGLPPEKRGAQLLANHKDFLDAETALRVAAAVRDGLANGGVS